MPHQTICQNPEDLARRCGLHLDTDQSRRSSGPLPGYAVALCAMLLKKLQARRWCVGVICKRISLCAVFWPNMG